MRARAERLPLRARAAVLAATGALLCLVAHGTTSTGDYLTGGAVQGDNPAPAINALIHGHLTAFVSQQPLMGLVSLVWRAPFAAVAAWFGGGPHLGYQLGMLACLLAVLPAALWLAAGARSALHWFAAAAAVALIAAGPATTSALALGHPEELLTALLAAGAVVVATQDRPVIAGALLGLAVGTKQWALIAVPCVLPALLGRRTVAAAMATAVAAPMVGLLPLLNVRAFAQANRWVDAVHAVNPLSAWWPLAGRHIGAGDNPAHLLPFSLTRGSAAMIALALSCVAIGVYAGRHRRGGPLWQVDGLALLAALGLVRCLADPLPDTYYFVACLIPLALWEAGTLRRLPLLSALVTVAVDVVPRAVATAAGHGTTGLSVLNALWLGAAVALGIHLIRRAVGPGAGPVPAGTGQDDGRASGWRGNPSSGIGSQAAA